MTDQKTPLKTKAKTLEDWYDDYEKLPNGLSDKKYIKELTKKLVLLSDAEPLELEIRQLKTQIKTAKQKENAYRHWIVAECAPNVWHLKEINEALKKFLEVFGKTET